MSQLELLSESDGLERVLNLTQKDAEIFFEAIENPPQPNEELVKAAIVYKREFFDD